MKTKVLKSVEAQETDTNMTLLHARQFPAVPIFDEHDELCGGIPCDWRAFQKASNEILKLAKPTDRISIRFRTTQDHKTGEIEVGIEAGN